MSDHARVLRLTCYGLRLRIRGAAWAIARARDTTARPHLGAAAYQARTLREYACERAARAAADAVPAPPPGGNA